LSSAEAGKYNFEVYVKRGVGGVAGAICAFLGGTLPKILSRFGKGHLEIYGLAGTERS